MKEDAQLICPIAYDDPGNNWSLIQQDIISRLPLRDVTWKNPVSSTFITISKLPLKFLSCNANLFKDTDHPFRWFLAPYVQIFITSVESLDAYKISKQIIKQWVDQCNSKKNYWLILFVPKIDMSSDLQMKVFNRIAADFYMEKAGDRIAHIIHSSHSIKLSQNQTSQYNDFFMKIREGVVFSFQQRLIQYDTDIRRLDSFRGTPQLEFRQLFLVKESLALMYQMMQLPSEALMQYEELEALLSFSPSGLLPDMDWPFQYLDQISSSKQSNSINSDSSIDANASSNSLLSPPPPPLNSENSIMLNLSSNSPNPSSNREYDGWLHACRNGDDVLLYSMNSARTRILKNKMSLWELHRYVFARQVFLLQQLHKPQSFIKKGFSFVTSLRKSIDIKLLGSIPLHMQVRTSLPNDDIFNHNLKSRQADLWCVVSSIKIIRSCLDDLRKYQSNNQIRMSQNTEDEEIYWDENYMQCILVIYDMLKFCLEKTNHLVDIMTNHVIHEIDDSLVFREHALHLATISYSSKHFKGGNKTSGKKFISTFIDGATITNKLSDGKFGGIEGILSQISKSLRNLAISKVNSTSPSYSQSAIKFQKEKDLEGNSLSSTPVKQTNVNITGTPDQDSNKSVIVESSLLVSLETIIAEINKILGRSNSYALDKLHCGDILLCYGNYNRAFECYCEAYGICNINLTSNSKAINKQKTMSSYHPLGLIKCFKDIISNVTSNVAIETKFWILRKMLVCALNIDNNLLTLIVLMEILKPSYALLKEFSNSDTKESTSCSFQSELMHDVHVLSQKVSTDDCDVVDMYALSLSPYFTIHSNIMHLTANQLKAAKLFVINDEIEVLNEKIPILVAQRMIEKDSELCMRMSLDLLSHFSEEIQVEEIQVVFRSLEYDIQLLKKLIESPQTVTVKDESLVVEDEINPDDYYISCFVPINPISKRISIVPGKQSFDIEFQPKFLGDFIVDKISIRLCKSVEFIQKFDKLQLNSSDNSNVMSNKKEVLRFAINQNKLLNVICKVPAFSPLFQKDVFELDLSTDEDIVEDLFVSVLGNSHPDFGESTEIIIDAAEKWIVKSSFDSSKIVSDSTMLFQHSSSLRQSLNLSVPFVCENLSDTAISHCKFEIRGTLLRKGCRINLEKVINKTIEHGKMFTISSSTKHWNYPNIFPSEKVPTISLYRQFRIKNISFLSAILKKCTIDLNHDLQGNIMQLDVNSTISNLNDIQDIVLQPDEEYYICVPLKYLSTNISIANDLEGLSKNYSDSVINFYFQRGDGSSQVFKQCMDMISIDQYDDSISLNIILENKINQYNNMLHVIYAMQLTLYNFISELNTKDVTLEIFITPILQSTNFAVLGQYKVHRSINLMDYLNLPVIPIELSFTFIKLNQVAESKDVAILPPLQIETKIRKIKTAEEISLKSKLLFPTYSI